MTAGPLPPESPAGAAFTVAERVIAHHGAYTAALDELAQALAETDLDHLQRDVQNTRERARPMARWLELLPSRIIAKEAP
jgi:hypothetical protein